MKIKILCNEHLKAIRHEWYRIINIEDDVLKIHLIKNGKRYELNWWIKDYTIDNNHKDKKGIIYKNGDYFHIANITLISKIHHTNGIIKQFYHDNLLKYEQQIGLCGYKEYIEPIKKE